MAQPGTWQSLELGGMSYQLLLPDGYSPGQDYPVLLFLHGGGQENRLPAMIDPWFNSPEFRTRYPAIVVAPQLKSSSYTTTWGGYPIDGTANSSAENQALAILQNVMSSYAADPDRVYVTGLSLGGHGTWDLMLKYNAYTGPMGHIFAAGLSMAGSEMGLGNGQTPSAADVAELQNVPIWAIHGHDGAELWDTMMSVMLPNGAYHYTAEPTYGEDVWDTYYRLPTGQPIFDWMFSQSADLGPAADAVSVRGAAGRVDLPFDDAANRAAAQAAIDPFNAAGPTPILEDGAVAQMQPGVRSIAAAGAATITGGATDGQLVLAGQGGIAFNAWIGAGTVVAGGGDNLVSAFDGSGAQTIRLGAGADTVVALAARAEIDAGAGRNLILAGPGATRIDSNGDDLIATTGAGSLAVAAHANAPAIYLGAAAAAVTGGSGAATIVGGDGNATIGLADGHDLVFAQGTGALDVHGGSGATTFYGAAGSQALLSGGSGSMIAASLAPLHFSGGDGAATVLAAGGNLTVQGGAGSGVFSGGTGGHNLLQGGSGSSVLFGGGDGDVLAAGTGAGDVLVGGPGAATLTGAGTDGNHSYYPGPGADLVLLGSGVSQLLAGSGATTVVAGSGAALFAFPNGAHGDMVIRNFDPGLDHLSLPGFAPGEAAAALASATTIAGSEHIALSDGSHIAFQSFSGLSAANFL